jgi:hypothetical protein
VLRPATHDAAISLLLRGLAASAGVLRGAATRSGVMGVVVAAAPTVSLGALRLACRATSHVTVLRLTARPASARAWRMASHE